VVQFTAIGLAGLVTVGLATLVASQRVGQREAIADVRTTTLVRAQGLVEPRVTDGLGHRDPAAVAQVGRAVTHGVLDANLVRVKIWTAAGTIVYASDPRLEGHTYELEADEQAALRTGSIAADVSDLAKPENRYERGYGKLLEVYLPIRSPDGSRLLFEAYYRFDVVSASADQIWRSFAPVALGALLVLELLQIPLAWSLARRLRQRQAEREALLERVLVASDDERRRIVGDLHDGVVQDLTGVSWSLAGAARAPATPEPVADVLDQAAESVRASVVDLRTLMVDLYPPDLEAAGFASGLEDLAGPAAGAGVAVEVDVTGLSQPLPRPVAALFHRAAREALRNVVAHAGATTASVAAGVDHHQAWLRVADDGVGFDPAVADERAGQGHLGLRNLDGLVRDLGGSLAITASGTGGTVVELEVPLW
jgi:signal transduction histidine kinase